MLTYPKLTVRTILNNFSVRSRISLQRIKASTIGNKLDRLPSLTCWRKENDELRLSYLTLLYLRGGQALTPARAEAVSTRPNAHPRM